MSKKPSDRILEIYKTLPATNNAIEELFAHSKSIITYLDEEWEKFRSKCPKCGKYNDRYEYIARGLEAPILCSECWAKGS